MVLVLKTVGSIKMCLDGEKLLDVTRIHQSVDSCLLAEDRANGIYVYEGEFEVRGNTIYGKSEVTRHS